MTVVEAQQIVRDFYNKQNCNPGEEEFLKKDMQKEV